MSTPTVDVEPNTISADVPIADKESETSAVRAPAWRRWLRFPLLLVAAGSAGWAYAEIANSLNPPPELPQGLPCHCDETDEASSSEQAGHADEGTAPSPRDESDRTEFSLKSI